MDQVQIPFLTNHVRRASLAMAMLFAGGVATQAHADVMEIDSTGYHWVTGGHAESVKVTDQAERSEEVPAGALTAPQSTAGPARWNGHVAALAGRYDISPALLEALVWQESRWNVNATSPVGAMGLTQLMPGTARQLGVDARNPAANLEGGARYLRAQLDAFDGNLEKALAAYNAGPGRVIRARGIPAIPETRAYVTSVMARLSDSVRR